MMSEECHVCKIFCDSMDPPLFADYFDLRLILLRKERCRDINSTLVLDS